MIGRTPGQTNFKIWEIVFCGTALQAAEKVSREGLFVHRGFV
jgi:hypothetical protein